MKKILSLLFMCLVLSLVVPTSVSAGGVWGSLNSTQKKACKRGWAFLRRSGYSKATSAGVLGNIDQENTFNPSGGGKHSYIQMDDGVWSDFCAWAKKEKQDSSDIAVQIRYALGTMRDKNWGEDVVSPKYQGWKESKDIVLGVEGFMVAFERCVNGNYSLQKLKKKGTQHLYQDGDKRIVYAKSIYKTLAGSDPQEDTSSASSKGKDKGSSSKTETKAQVIAELKAVGAYNEKDIEAFDKLNEIPIDSKYLGGLSRDGLDQTRTTGLSDWEDNVRLLSGDSFIVRILRVIIVGIGICMVVWSLFLYTAYWFDRINVFFDIDLLGILSFGRLHKSDNELECTFQMKDFGKTNTMTVNHKAVLRICIFGIMIGVSIVSGLFYKILGGFVNGIIRFFGG